MATTITITMSDVLRHGGIRDALIDACDKSDTVACGVIGPAFATSGPGSGWSKQYDETDFAARAFEGGALAYLDLDNGRLATSPDWDRDEYAGQPIEWTDESVVCLECPDIQEAIDEPGVFAEMAAAVAEIHDAESNCREWAKMLASIRKLAECIEEVQIDG
mgnify:FL=1|jgi:hypothetical protein